AGPIAWTMPTDWSQLDPKPMRLVTFKAGGAEVIVTGFPAGSGSLLSNLNRWREQVPFPPIEDDSKEPKTGSKVAGTDATVYDFVGPAKKSTVTIVRHGEQDFFFKIIGPTDDVTKQASNYQQFLESIRFSQ